MEREQTTTIEEIYQAYIKKIRKAEYIFMSGYLVAIVLAIISFFI